ncbi:hypothetical protein D1007_17213 [Hordeum vulgare]|nr:hypothetical protein D1007_17213 [Hordeum vulgare]
MLKLPTMLSRLYLTPSLKGVFRTNHAVAYVTDNILSTRSPEVTISELKIRFLLLPNDSLIICRSVARAMATQKVAAAEFEIVTKKRYSLCSSADLLQLGSSSMIYLVLVRMRLLALRACGCKI